MNYRCVLAGVALALGVTPAAHAQDDQVTLDEITVTAAYREQSLQDVPVSISAVTGDRLTETGFQKAEDIQFLVPNFNINETGIATNIFIRGIGSGINQGFEQSVGTYIDGVYYGRAQQIRAPFLDLERIEVLRGPQSILFGKNSVAGALNITTAGPTDEFEGRFFLSNEFEDSEIIAEGVLSGPLSDRVRARVAARSRQLDGYVTNATLGTDEPEREDWTVRGTLEIDVSDNLTATLKAEIGEFDVLGRNIEVVNEQPGGSGATYSQILAGVFMQDPSVLNTVQDGIRSANGDFSFNESQTFMLELDWGIGEMDLESITAISDFEYNEFCDCDFTGADVFGAALQEEYSQFSQEFRLSSPVRDNFDWIAGVYFQTSDHDYADQIVVENTSILVPAVNGIVAGAGTLISGTQAARVASVENDVISAFAQFNWHLSDTFTLQLGGRVTKDERDGNRTLRIETLDGTPLTLTDPNVGSAVVYANLFGISSTQLADIAGLGDPTAGALLALLGEHPVSGSRDETKFSPEIKGVWALSDDSLVYLSWANGFKSGSFDFRANNRNFYPDMASSFEYDDEEASNFELGGKFTLAGGAAEINAAAFFTNFEDLQVSIFDGTLGFNVGNAAEAEIFGLEIDGRWAATESLTISGGLALIDFEFKDFEQGQPYFGQPVEPGCTDDDMDGSPELCPYTGNTNQSVSDFQANLSFMHYASIGSNLELRTSVDIFHTGEYEASATFDPALVQDAYTTFNLRLGVGPQDGTWEVALLGKNLSDERVLTFGGDVPLAGSTFGAKSNYAFFSRGRTLTLQGSVRF